MSAREIFMRLGLKHFFNKFVSPISQNEDGARREFILNIFLITVICWSFAAFIMKVVKKLMSVDVAMSTGTVFIILSLFIFLYFLSRKGYSRTASFLFLITIFLLVSYMGYIWGVELPLVLLAYVLIIVMTSILINTQSAFLTTFIIISTIAVINYLQRANIIQSDHYWRTTLWGNSDVIVISILFFIIAIVSWLSNREIEKLLARARRSEAELKQERDSLEVTVEERTKELKETQAEKMAQLYRFAEFGRLSSGLFHDLINPLNAVSLNMERLKNQRAWILKDAPEQVAPIAETSDCLNRAIRAAKKLEDLVIAVRKQLARQENEALFSLNEEIQYVIDVLVHKARKANVEMRFPSARDIKIFGDAVKFNQVALNLIVNAIDAYLLADKSKKEIVISLDEVGGRIILSVKDYGMGIPEENIQKIFEPFFTTKAGGRGIGIGLSMTKRIVEKDFGGNIGVISKVGEGTMFTVQFPNKKNDKKY